MTTKKLNRPVGPRKALVKNLLSQLYLHGTVETTLAKAKAVQPLADRLIQQAKPGTVAARRQLSGSIADAEVLKKLVDIISPRYSQLSSGFTRIVRVGQRRGDNAMMAKLMLIGLQDQPAGDQPPAVVAPAAAESKAAKPEKRAAKTKAEKPAKPSNPKK